MKRAKILVVDDDTHLVEALSQLLAGDDYEVTCASSAEAAIECCRADTFHLVLCDLNLPGRNGLTLIKTLHEVCPSTVTVLITGHGTVRVAIAAVKRGAVEYLQKPIKPRRLLALCASLTLEAPEFLPNDLLVGDRAQAVSFEGMQARSQAMRGVFDRLRIAAGADATVLVTGESGTGKELAARAIHRRSARSGRPFVIAPVSALTRERIGVALFGDQRGVASHAGRAPGLIEEAEGGTLFIDEASALDEQAQIGLLRLLETKRFSCQTSQRERSADVRVVAASSRDLPAAVKAGELRADLYYRLGAFAIQLPPLRERREDVSVLAAELLVELGRAHGRPVAALLAETQRLLAAWAWPGNVRELRNVIEQAVLLGRGPTLGPALLPPEIRREAAGAELIKIAIGTPMENIEKEVILRTLEANRGNKTATAGVLGISRRSIYNKLATYGV